MITGRAWKYGDNVNTDIIFPGRYTYVLMNEEEMGNHALEDLDSEFSRSVLPGDIIVAGKNWGCGSAREQAVKALCAKGVSAIVAKSVSRIYFRNCLNEGLPIIICPEAVDLAKAGDIISVNLSQNKVAITDTEFLFAEYDSFVREMLDCGGLIAYTRRLILMNEQGS